ncbi:MAG: hypothetical protein JRJ08_00310 [Deltaproteobacteria bacterium]|nr:hypothetical protein [Deltaproteobacteria bacterium]
MKFNHKTHVGALKEKGCNVCHPADKEGNLAYTYPKIRNEKNKESLMNSYHDDCIGCHNKIADAGKKTGPVTCGECHIRENRQQAQKKVRWLDAGFDYYSHNLHVEFSDGDCGICHHTGDMSSCRDCHSDKDEDESSSFRNAAHSSCINCHLEYEAGPSSCKGCHSETKRTAAEMAYVSRPEIGQPDKTLITIKEAKMKGVPFSHEIHQGHTRSCRNCHHKTMSSCKTCHTLKGTAEGGRITLAFAYHEVSSERSCIGCHESKKLDAACSGCHHLRESGLIEESCLVCHSGPSDEACAVSMLGFPDDLLPESLPEVIELSGLEKDYMPANFPHYAHIEKLTDISNNDTLAKRFHSNQMTVCLGCHHNSPMEAKIPIPPCITCHTPRMESQKNIPTLSSAYHRQCIGCHKEMGTKPTDCTGCHAQKLSSQSEK